MPTRRTLIKASTGVRLERVETLSARGRVQRAYFTLRTLRPNPPRIIAEEAAALDAFDLEVIASLSDPVVSKLADQRRRPDA